MLQQQTRPVPAAAGGVQPPRLARAASDTERFFSLEERLLSFQQGGWPVAFISAEDMAAAGFYSLRRGDDAAKCPYCDIAVSSWEPGDVPLSEHLRWSPRCPFLRASRPGHIDAVSYDSCSPYERAPQPTPQSLTPAAPAKPQRPVWPQYCSRQARLDSFGDWPPAIPLKPAALSEAGFFYSGKGDRTICYYCGGGLRDWEPTDDPWKEHELWFPGCAHVELHRGKEFVGKIADDREATITARRASRAAATDSNATQSQPEAEKTTVDADNKEVDTSADERRMCKICFENEMGVVFLPCGHIVACVDCALSVSVCPVCRQTFDATAKVYLS